MQNEIVTSLRDFGEQHYALQTESSLHSRNEILYIQKPHDDEKMYKVSKEDNEYDNILLVRHKERKDQLKLNFDAYDTYSTPISFGHKL